MGLSRQKVKGIKNLAQKVLSKDFKPRLISKMSDEDAIIYLSQLRQIGKMVSRNDFIIHL